MMRHFKFTLSILAISALFFWSMTYAQSIVDRYIIELSNNPFQINEAVDMTIKAVDKNGDIVKSYVWDALIEVQGLQDADVTYPNNGVVSFVASDQWQKKFNKGLIIKKSGTFKLSVRDIIDDYVWNLSIEVKSAGSTSSVSAVTITSPIKDSIESNQNVNVVGNSKDFPNSPFKLFVDDKESTPSNTNENGDFSLYTDNLSLGEHTIQIKIFNSSDEIVAESEKINFKIEQSAGPVFKSILIVPSSGAKVDEKIDVTVSTNPETRVVELIIWENSFFMEKSKEGEFIKSLKISKSGDYDVDLKLSSDNGTKSFTKVDSINIIPSVNNSIDSDFVVKNLRYTYAKDTNRYNLSRQYEGDMKKFIVLIWKQKDNLQQTATIKELVPTNNFTFTPAQHDGYFVQVYGVDSMDNISGVPSDIIYLSAPIEYTNVSVCKVDSIHVDTTKIWDKYFLIWDKISWVDRYIVYNSDYPTDNINSMVKIGETSQNKFEYYFDEKAPTPTYKYYIVQGICSDGKKIQAPSSEKVQVWPMNLAIYVTCFALFAYTSFRLRRNSDN